MYALIKDGTVEQYPYTIYQLRIDNPNVSFPLNPTNEDLASFNVYAVLETPRPVFDPVYNSVLEEDPTELNGAWVQNWSVVTVADDEVRSRIAEQWTNVRSDRNARISACDWTQLPDAPVDAAAWAEYRQALRDITDQPDPFNIVWPQEPE